MAWITWCDTHDEAWYDGDLTCQDPYTSRKCLGRAFASIKIGFDNKLELDINELEKEDLHAWMMKTKKS